MAGGRHLKTRQDDRMLQLAAESGCTMLSIGFESISRTTLKSVHKHVNQPDNFAWPWSRRYTPYGIMVFGLFMFGFDGDDQSVFDETVNFNINAKYDACAYSVLTPCRHAHMVRDEEGEPDRLFRLVDVRSEHVVYRPAQMSSDELPCWPRKRLSRFYSTSSITSPIPLRGERHPSRNG